MSAVLTRDAGCGLRCLTLVDQIASAQRSKDDNACRHRESQNEHDDDQPRAPVKIVFGPHDTCCPGDDHAQQDKSQGYAWRGESVRHQADFLAVPRTGMGANRTARACSEAMPAVSHLYDGRQS